MSLSAAAFTVLSSLVSLQTMPRSSTPAASSASIFGNSAFTSMVTMMDVRLSFT